MSDARENAMVDWTPITGIGHDARHCAANDAPRPAIVHGDVQIGQRSPRPPAPSIPTLSRRKAVSGHPRTGESRMLRSRLLTASVAALACIVAASPRADSPAVGVAPQYGTTHVYVAPDQLDHFVQSFLATFGGASTKQVVATVTPTPSSTTSQLLQTPVGTVSLFGFKTPIPYPFGAERTGYLVTDLDAAVASAKAAGADVLVEPFPDPIGRDAVVQWPGGVNMQLYWHTTKPSYAAFQSVPENRVYIPSSRLDDFVRDFVAFAHGRIVSDDAAAPGIEIGRGDETHRRVRIASDFGRVTVFASDGHLPYPYGRELTGYEVGNLTETLAKAKSADVTVLVAPFTVENRDSAVVQFPGGYIAEIHALR
jgi:hypothetical protein